MNFNWESIRNACCANDTPLGKQLNGDFLLIVRYHDIAIVVVIGMISIITYPFSLQHLLTEGARVAVSMKITLADPPPMISKVLE